MSLLPIYNGISAEEAANRINAGLAATDTKAALVRGAGIVQGYTTAAQEPVYATTIMSLDPDNFISNGSINFTKDGTQIALVVISDTDPGGALWIYNNGSSISPTDAANSIIAAFSGHAELSAAVGYPYTGTQIKFTLNSMGSLAISPENIIATFDPSPSVGGTPGVEPSGAITEVQLVAAVAGKSPRLLIAGVVGTTGGVSAQMEIALKLGANYYPLANQYGVGSNQRLPLTADGSTLHFDGLAGASIVGRIISGLATSPIGGQAKLWVIAERN